MNMKQMNLKFSLTIDNAQGLSQIDSAKCEKFQIFYFCYLLRIVGFWFNVKQGVYDIKYGILIVPQV